METKSDELYFEGKRLAGKGREAFMTPYYRIGIDLDGVLVDFMKEFPYMLCRIEGIPYPSSFIPRSWEWYGDLGVKPETVREAWNIVANDPTFWQYLPVTPKFHRDKELLQRLSKDGHDLYFITHRPFKGARHASALWLTHHLAIPNPTVLISSAKGAAAQALALNFFLDDKPENCYDVLTKRGVRTAVYLYAQPYNETFKDPYIPKVSDFTEAWEDFLKHRSEGY